MMGETTSAEPPVSLPTQMTLFSPQHLPQQKYADQPQNLSLTPSLPPDIFSESPPFVYNPGGMDFEQPGMYADADMGPHAGESANAPGTMMDMNDSVLNSLQTLAEGHEYGEIGAPLNYNVWDWFESQQ